MNAAGRRFSPPPLLPLVIAAAGVLGACRSAPSASGPTAAAVKSSHAGGVLVIPHAADLDAGRLQLDLRRSVRDLGWGWLRVEQGSTAADADSPPALRAKVLTPHGITVVVEARQRADGSLQLAAAAGPFGDATIEHELLTEYERKLTGRPAPRRGRGFDLPGPPP